MAELSDSIHNQIKGLCAIGDDCAQKHWFADALFNYWAAWDLFPEPKTQWEAATWILVAIGDANVPGRDYVAGCDNLSNAMRCPGAVGNPFIHFRLGQCQFELGNHDRAADEFTRAYMGSGRELFELLGKQRKESAEGGGPPRAERAGASESLGWGEVVLSRRSFLHASRSTMAFSKNQEIR